MNTITKVDIDIEEAIANMKTIDICELIKKLACQYLDSVELTNLAMKTCENEYTDMLEEISDEVLINYLKNRGYNIEYE